MGLKNTMVNIDNDSFVIMVHLNLEPLAIPNEVD
jgi:hypothetical protein